MSQKPTQLADSRGRSIASSGAQRHSGYTTHGAKHGGLCETEMIAGLEGGQRAARGLHYQYLRTLEELLALVEQEESDAHVVYVEGKHSNQHDVDDPTLIEVIDYEVRSHDGRRLKVAQVKSVDNPEDAAPLGAAAIMRIFIELVGTDAESYEIITNARLQDRASLWTAGLVPVDGDMLGAVRLACNGSPTMRETLDRLTKEQISRLRRCMVVRDDRRADELRADLIARLRQYRQIRNVGLGNAAAGLLTKSLIGELLSKAGKRGEDRAVPLDTFRRDLLTSRTVMAHSLGAYDWGIPIGAPPNTASIVERPSLIARIASALDGAIVNRMISACVLTGRSGLGKTSLVANYLREHGGAYDFALWVDCESPEAVSDSWSRIGRVLGADLAAAGRGEEDQRDRVQYFLSTYPGTWLLVFDNAADASLVNQWWPTGGSGHVIVTSTDSSSWNSYTSLAIPPMSSEEAVEMLRDRFDIDPTEDIYLLLQQLAIGVEFWPLALEMAAGYLKSIGRGAESIPQYLDALRRQALDDRDSVPPGYPRTLVAAIRLCLNRLSSHEEEGPANEDGATRVMVAASYLSSRFIPDILLLRVLTVEPSLDHKVICEPTSPAEQTRIDLIVRALRSESLLEREDRSKLQGESDGAGIAALISDTLHVSEIVQEVVRIRSENRSMDNAVSVLDSLTFQLQGWLKQYLDTRDFVNLDALNPHVVSLLKNWSRIGQASISLALMMGNFASVCSTRGEYLRAVDLLDQELQILTIFDEMVGETEPSFIHLNVRQMLAMSMMEAEFPPLEVQSAAEGALAVLVSLQADTGLDRLVGPATNLYNIFHTLRWHGVTNVRLEKASREIADILDSLPQDPVALALRHMTIALAAGGSDDDIAADCLVLLADPQLLPEQRTVALGLRCEALALMRRSSDTLAAVRLFESEIRSAYFRDARVTHLLNTGVTAALFLIEEGTSSGWLEVESEVTALAEQAVALGRLRDGDLHRFHLLKALVFLGRGDGTGARKDYDLATQYSSKSLRIHSHDATRTISLYVGSLLRS